MHKIIVGCVALLALTCSYADEQAAPVNLAHQCQPYLIPEDQFRSFIENLSLTNFAQAQSVAAWLSQCAHYNSCNQLTDTSIQNCSGTLATNAYLGTSIVEYHLLNSSNPFSSEAPAAQQPPPSSFAPPTNTQPIMSDPIDNSNKASQPQKPNKIQDIRWY